MKDTRSSGFLTRYGPWALVAGASAGLGAEYASLLADKGLNLVLVARRAEELQELSARLVAEKGVQVQPIALDLAQPDPAAQLAVQTEGKEIGLLICNAAFAPTRLFFDL